MLIHPQESALLLVDVQARLLPAIADHDTLVAHCDWLVRAAKDLAIPMLCSEQYPQGLGPTVPELRAHFSDDAIIGKTAFSCAAEPACLSRIEGLNRRQIVIAGIEAHVCVLQTAIELRQRGLHVFVVADAVASRNPDDVELALARMSDAGVIVVSREMAVFEWMQRAGTDSFRHISKTYLR